MNGPYAAPQVCPICGAGPYVHAESMRRHAAGTHPFLTAREVTDLLAVAQAAAQGARSPDGHDLSLRYPKPAWCPRCERGPWTLPLGLVAHAFVWHGYLSYRELSDLMDTAWWRANGGRNR